MANSVSESLVSKRLQIVIHDGVNASGTAKLKTKTFANLNADATKEQLGAAADALIPLYKNEVANVYHSEKFLLQNVEVDDNGGAEDGN